MTPDIDKYRPFVDRFDLSDEQKIELIHTLWKVMEGFADRAFGLDPATLVIDGEVAQESSQAVGLTQSFEKSPPSAKAGRRTSKNTKRGRP